jgi:hypothetical protein
MACGLLLAATNIGAFDLWNGLDTEMGRDEIIEKVKQIFDANNPGSTVSEQTSSGYAKLRMDAVEAFDLVSLSSRDTERIRFNSNLDQYEYCRLVFVQGRLLMVEIRMNVQEIASADTFSRQFGKQEALKRDGFKFDTYFYKWVKGPKAIYMEYTPPGLHEKSHLFFLDLPRAKKITEELETNSRQTATVIPF